MIRREWLIVTGCLILVASAAAQESQPVEALRIAQSRVFQSALRAVTPSVVRIDTVGGALPTRGADEAGAFRQADGPTTGVIWRADGWILASSFNFIRNPSIITVSLADGRRFVAKLVAQDSLARLALLKIDAKELPAPVFAPLSELAPGQWVLAAGFGHGADTPAVCVGALSALHRMDDIAVQTDAKISPVNYGGPLFDIEGRLIGVCAPLSPNDDDLAGVEWYDSGIGFAVRCDYIARKIDRLMAGETLERGILGLILDDRQPVETWPLDELLPSDPADSSELQALENAQSPQSAPSSVPAEADSESPATTSAPQSRPARPPGLLVLRPPVGPAAEAGMQVGDVVTRIDDQDIVRTRDYRMAIARLAAGDEAKVTYWHNGDLKTFSLRLATREELRAAAEKQQQP